MVTVLATTIAAPSPASASIVDDLLGIISGSGSEPPPPESPPPERPAPDGGPPKPTDQPIPPSSQLLPSEPVCPGQSDPKLPARAQSRVMRCLLSYARVAKDRPALRGYDPLRVSATHKARDIRRCQRLSHTACGRDTWYWLERVGFFKGTWSAGEVLAVGGGQKGTAQGTIRRWLGSKPHRAALLHPKFNLVGVGVLMARFRGDRHMRIWVAHLGYRR